MIKRIVLNPKTPFTELFSADQIWGQFIWAISDLEGEEKASEVVEKYKENPPILFSSLMLDGYLIKPCYSNSRIDTSTEKGKHNKKCNWLSYKDFYSFQKNADSLSNKELDISSNSFIEQNNEIRVSLRGKFIEGKEKNELVNKFYLSSKKKLVIYVDIKNEEFRSLLEEKVIEYWNTTGLGGDKNIGRGQFDISIEDLSETEGNIFNYKSDGTFVSLSETFGNGIVPLEYSIDVYSGIASRTSRFRKKPIIRFLKGSLFSRESEKGTIIKSIDEDTSVYSYGYAFPVEVTI